MNTAYRSARSPRLSQRWSLFCRWLLILFALWISGPWPSPPSALGQSPGGSPSVNAPYFTGDVLFDERAVFWFGEVTSQENYADVRLGYNANALVLHLAVFDRWLWYDISPSVTDLTAWDAATVCLSLGGNTGDGVTTSTYRFEAQLNHWQARTSYQAVYRGSATGWATATVPFTTTSVWRGAGLNDGSEARGWTVQFEVPFTGMGLSGPPSRGSVWGLALVVHDRDDAAGTAIPNKMWPEAADTQRPASWGRLVFGLPSYSQPLAAPGGLVTIRHGLDGLSVVDAHVGGHSICGDPFGPIFFNGWGDANYAHYDQINIQNQIDVADWPCFSKYYVTFPLGTLPADKVIISATLTLHQFGNAGDPGAALPSLIQVLTVAEDWNEATITWNNAPLVRENVASTWVYPMTTWPGWPGLPVVWDVSLAVAQAYLASQPLRLALYSADGAYHSGKYFVSSDTGDWNSAGRPTLRVWWGHPLSPSGWVYLPLILKR